MLRKGTLLTLVLVLAGCSTPYNAITKTAKVLWDPDIPVGHPEDLPSQVDLAMLAEPDVNPNDARAATPINFQVIELRDDSLLMAGEFDELMKELEDTLGRNYVGHNDYTLVPGEFKFTEPFDVDGDTRYIGVIAFYSDPNRAQWKKVIAVDPEGGQFHLLVNLRERDVVLEKSGD